MRVALRAERRKKHARVLASRQALRLKEWRDLVDRVNEKKLRAL